MDDAQHLISVIDHFTYLLCLLVHSAESVTATADIDRLKGYDEELRKNSAALLLLKLKEQRRVSQVAVDDIIEHTKAQFDNSAC